MTSECLDRTVTTTVEDHLELVCDMNNAAVDLLADGNFESAQVVFAKATRAARVLVRNDTIDDHTKCRREIEPSLTDSLFQTSVVNTCRAADGSKGEANFASSDIGAFVYHRVFKLRHDQCIPPLETICVIILYNMVRMMKCLNATPGASLLDCL